MPRDELVTSFPCRSVLQLGGSYELALQLLLDIVAAMLQQGESMLQACCVWNGFQL